jgi:hypothetical protein
MCSWAKLDQSSGTCNVCTEFKLAEFFTVSQARSNDMERIIHKCHGINDIRNAETLILHGFRTTWSESNEDVQEVIHSRIERLALKDKCFFTRDQVSKVDVQILKSHLEQLLPNLDVNRLQKAIVAKSSVFQH